MSACVAIRVTYKPLVGPVVEVEIAEGRELAVLQRAAERIFPGPHDAAAEADSERRFRDVMAQRGKRERLAG